jgi:hypothetical protein
VNEQKAVKNPAQFVCQEEKQRQRESDGGK